MQVELIDEQGYWIETIIIEAEPQSNMITTRVPTDKQGFYKPRWNGTSWEEGATQEYIDSLQSQLSEPTEADRLEALEMLMVDILGGVF